MTSCVIPREHRPIDKAGREEHSTPGENVIMMVMVVIPGAIISFNTEAAAYWMSVPRWAVCSCSRVIPFNLPSSLMRWILLLSSFYNCGAAIQRKVDGLRKSLKPGRDEPGKLPSAPLFIEAPRQPPAPPRSLQRAHSPRQTLQH